MTRRFWTLLAVATLAAASLGSAVGVAAAGGTVRTAKLAGTHEVPPITTSGTGSATITISDDNTTITYSVTYSGLSGAPVAAHIHVGDIGANGPIIIPFTLGAGATGPSGTITGTATSANFTGANGLTFAQALDKIKTGGAYVNVHTAAHPGGEIRGQLYDAASAQTYVISADAPEAVPAGHIWGFNDYFPRTLTVAQGSTVMFAIKGFHTGTILPIGMTAAQDFAAGGGALAQDSDDTGRNPNGTSPTNLNIAALSPILPSATCGTAASPCAFDGTKIVSEGAPLGPPSPPTAIKVTAPAGTYEFHCRVHTEMTGTLTVVAAGDAAVSAPDDLAAQSTAAIAAETASANATMAAKDAASHTTSANGMSTWIINLGAETPDHKVAILEMLPAKVTIKSGDRVVWRVQGRNEPHTVTFPTDIHTDMVPTCEGTGGADKPCQGPPDEISFSPGNGISHVTTTKTVSDSGTLMAAVSIQSFGVRSSSALHTWRVSFAGASKGTYTYVCQIHTGMNGSIVVK